MNLKWALLVATAVAIPTSGVMANDELMKLEKDPNQWVMPTGNYANHRYSELKQINKDNVKNLHPVWTFSTGVLRGHEGGPLVIGDVMYVHTPFPNNVFALDLNKNGQILWKYEPKQDPTVIPVMCCDTVNRGVAYGDGKIILDQADTTVVALDAKTGQEVWKRQERRSEEGRDDDQRPDGRQGQGHRRHQRRRVRRPGPRHRLQSQGRLEGMAGLFGRPRRPDPVRRQDHRARQAGRQGFVARRPGRATSGRSAAATPGAGTPTTRS